MRMNLKLLRIKKCLTQEEVSAALGYKEAYYGHVERGSQRGSAVFWNRLQNFFGLTELEIKELKKND